MDKVIEEDHPRILATGTSGHNININFQNQPYDQASAAIDGEMHDQDEHYMTHLKGGYFLNYFCWLLCGIFSIINS